jgi:hypothetical protein
MKYILDLLTRYTVYTKFINFGDAIIQFFNKHSMRSDSPSLPRNASQAQKYIENLHEPNSSF